MPYESPNDWRDAAMRRSATVGAEEVRRRRAVAEAHHRLHGQPDADALADQELYILGKMELDEYRDYLIFKFMYGVE
ncbi:MAG TPA: hypothetical protein VNH42_06710 [Mariprofundaceae bacterium]|nr:hypothetical protein [Mariprofundaceae bacterium]